MMDGYDYSQVLIILDGIILQIPKVIPTTTTRTVVVLLINNSPRRMKEWFNFESSLNLSKSKILQHTTKLYKYKTNAKRQTTTAMASFPHYSTTTNDYLHKYNLRPNTSSTAAATSSSPSSFDADTNDAIARIQSLKVDFDKKQNTTSSSYEPFIIGVAGGSASGKTTVCIYCVCVCTLTCFHT
jgi:hypothetical protein